MHDNRIPESPSLRGSGLKFVDKIAYHTTHFVSLFTREWIEIPRIADRSANIIVSLFTREWIEIIDTASFASAHAVSLFTREWIEIQTGLRPPTAALVSLFTREWIEIANDGSSSLSSLSPSLRGSGLKLGGIHARSAGAKVSLFTREWIEI